MTFVQRENALLGTAVPQLGAAILRAGDDIPTSLHDGEIIDRWKTQFKL